MSKFTKLCFKSKDEHEIIIAVKFLEKLGYSYDQYFSTDYAAIHGGLCAWDDGELTEGWLDIHDGFNQVTLEDLKEMVDECDKYSVFTLERLLGCEVLFENRYQSSKGYISSVDDGCSVTLDCGVITTLPNMYRLTFFTEEGDELTFDEYVKMYYGE